MKRPSSRSLSSIRAPWGRRFEHHLAEGALAGTLLAALEHDDNASMFVRVLYGPSEVANEILELLPVASADDLADMPKKPALLLPALARLDTEAPPQIVLVGSGRAGRLEDNDPFVPIGIFFPELFGRDRLAPTRCHLTKMFWTSSLNCSGGMNVADPSSLMRKTAVSWLFLPMKKCEFRSPRAWQDV